MVKNNNKIVCVEYCIYINMCYKYHRHSNSIYILSIHYIFVEYSLTGWIGAFINIYLRNTISISYYIKKILFCIYMVYNHININNYNIIRLNFIKYII